MSSVTVAPPATRSATLQRAASNGTPAPGGRPGTYRLPWARRPGTHRLSWAGDGRGRQVGPAPAHLAALSATSLPH